MPMQPLNTSTCAGCGGGSGSTTQGSQPDASSPAVDATTAGHLLPAPRRPYGKHVGLLHAPHAHLQSRAYAAYECVEQPLQLLHHAVDYHSPLPELMLDESPLQCASVVVVDEQQQQHYEYSQPSTPDDAYSSPSIYFSSCSSDSSPYSYSMPIAPFLSDDCMPTIASSDTTYVQQSQQLEQQQLEPEQQQLEPEQQQLHLLTLTDEYSPSAPFAAASPTGLRTVRHCKRACCLFGHSDDSAMASDGARGRGQVTSGGGFIFSHVECTAGAVHCASPLHDERYQRRLIWSDELQSRFLEVLRRLADEKQSIVPTAVLREMKVPGLTRANVASHLQKHRLGACRLKRRRARRGTAQEADS